MKPAPPVTRIMASCSFILGTGRLDIFSLSPPPQPSPTRGEGWVLLPPPLWGRVGVGGTKAPSPLVGEGWGGGDQGSLPPCGGGLGWGGPRLPPPLWGRVGGGGTRAPSPLVGEGWGGGKLYSIQPCPVYAALFSRDAQRSAFALCCASRLNDAVASSNKLRYSRPGDRGYRQGAEFIGRRRQILLGIQGHVPGDDLAGVGGHAPHDGHQRALGHPFAVVDRLAGADAGEQLVVLVLIHIIGGRITQRRYRLPSFCLSRHDDAAWRTIGLNVASPLGTHNVIGNIRGTADLLTASAEQLHAVFVFVNYTMVIENVPIERIRAYLPAAAADGADRIRVLHGPSHLVEAVDVLLDVEIAGQPGKVEPVAQLPFHVAPFGPAFLGPQAAGIIGALQ